MTPPADSTLARMLARGWEFDFFQAAWLLERYCPDSGIQGYAKHVKAARVGERGPLSCDPLRFRPPVSMGFPPTDVRRVESLRNPENQGYYFRLDVTFMGLYGVCTPLPLHYARNILIS